MSHLALKIPLNFLILAELDHLVSFDLNLVLTLVIMNHLAPEPILLLILYGAQYANLISSCSYRATVSLQTS